MDLSASTYGTCGVRVGGALECWGSFPGREDGVPEGSFVAVSLGGGHACALRVDASVVCWGDNEFGEADAPAGGFVYVDVGEIWGRPVSCGVRVGGSVVCWGVGEFGHLEVPQQGVFTKVFAGSGCGLRDDGDFVCWAEARHREALWADVPAGRFVELSLGEIYGCARRAEGSVLCWRLDSSPRAPTPGGVVWPDRVQLPVEDFVSVSVGRKRGDTNDVERVCGLHAGGSVSCWPLYTYGKGSKEYAEQVVADATLPSEVQEAGVGDPFAGPYVDLAMNRHGQCGLRDNGEAVCWGWFFPTERLGEVTGIAASAEHVCGIGPDGAIGCWSRLRDIAAAMVPPAGVFTDIAAGSRHMCALREDRGIACWTRRDRLFDPGDVWYYTPDGELQEPVTGLGGELFGGIYTAEGEFIDVSAGGDTFCGLRADATAVCWGGDARLRRPPGGEFTQVAAGWDRPCGIRPDGRIECWGYDGLGEPAPSIGPLIDAAGSCGIRPDGTWVCWNPTSGDENNSQSQEGTYVSIHSGTRWGCAIAEDGTVRCWSDAIQPPRRSGPFIKVAPGSRHGCGILTDGTVECWGEKFEELPDPMPRPCSGPCDDRPGRGGRGRGRAAVVRGGRCRWRSIVQDQASQAEAGPPQASQAGSTRLVGLPARVTPCLWTRWTQAPPSSIPRPPSEPCTA